MNVALDPNRPPKRSSQASSDELKEAVREAQHANSVLSTLIDTLPIGVVIADAEGRLLTTNQAGTRILRGPAMGTIDRPQALSRTYHTDGTPFPPAEMPLALAVKKGISTRDVEIVLPFDDGEETILSASASPLIVDDRVAGGVVVFQDITERTRREQAHERLLAQLRAEQGRAEVLTQTLRRERDILDAIMENTRTHLFYLDTEFNFLKVNSAYAQGAGRSKEELLGRNHFELFPNEENQAIFEKVRDSGESTAFEAKPFTYPDRPELGVTYWDWTLVPVKDSGGRVVGLVCSLLDVTERHKAEAEMASLARFPGENPHPVLRVQEDGTLIYANAGSVPLLRAWGTELGARVPQRWRAYVREAIRTQQASSAKAEVGASIFSLTIAPSPDGYANLYAMDITALRRAQSSLRQYAHRLRTLHHIDQAILSAQSTEAIAEAALTRLPQIIDCIRASVMIFDLEAETASLLAVYTAHGESRIGKGWQAPIPADIRAQLDQLRQGHHVLTEDIQAVEPTSALAATLQAEEVRALLQQPLRAEGELIGVLRLGLPQPGPVPMRLIELAKELADQLAIAIQQSRLHRQVEEYTRDLEQRVIWRTAALRISEARFRAIFEDAPMGIALLNQEGRIIQSNAALEAILGADSAEIRNHRLGDYMLEEDAAAEAKLYTALMDGSSEGYRTEARFLRGNDQMIWCNVSVSLVRDAEYEPRLAIGIIEDITERRIAQATMIQTEKLALTGRLAASLAHEINNPLQTVIGCLGLATETMTGQEEARVYLDMASSELRRAADIVRRLRDLNRPSNPEEKEVASLWELVDHVLAVTEKQCRDHEITVHARRPDDDELTARVVPDRIQQVFLNLILNAIDAMPQGGELTVSSSRTAHPSGVWLTFQDTGVGIPPEIQARMFDPFQTTKPDGLGLGLYISQSIIKAHHGRIEVKSTPGEGTTFSVWLPLEQQ